MMRRRFSIGLAACEALWQLGRGAALAILAASAGPLYSQTVLPPGDVATIDFSRLIRPLLSDRCFRCHGPDAEQRQADLRLDRRDVAIDERGVIVPGDPAASELVRRITATDPAERMPPADSGLSLSPEEIAHLTQWIVQGATWREHWSLTPPQRPALPAVSRSEWPRNDIDRFVLAALDERGLQPSAPADPRTLVRRVFLDLTGLPPTPEDVRDFLADERPDSYERLVDRLLASPHYGEHMARYWLDAARYADTHGLHFDNYREIWMYRDWVINAFNDNLPYRDFVIEQLAGDLLPSPTQAQLIATGFCRAHVTTNEGGSIDEEVEVRNVVDRVSTMGTAMMGLTLGCAACHDHKYDPVSQREFYELYAFFNSLEGPAMDGNIKNPPPVLAVPSDDQQQALADADAELARIDSQVAAILDAYEYVEPVADGAENDYDEPTTFVWLDDALPAGARQETSWTFISAAAEAASASAIPVDSDVAPHAGIAVLRRSASGLSQFVFSGVDAPLRVAPDDELFAHVYLDPRDPPQQIMLQWNDGTWEHRASWGADIIPFGEPGTTSRRNMGDLPATGQWIRLAVPAATVGLTGATRINGLALTQFGGTVWWDSIGLVSRHRQATEFHSLAQWISTNAQSKGAGLAEPIQAIFAKETAQWTAAESAAVRRHYLQFVHAPLRPTVAPLNEQRRSAEAARAAIEAAIPTTLVYRETATPRDAYFLRRGQYDQRGDRVERDVPAALPPFPPGATRNRLGLAQWLTSDDHPLPARVAVNRFWQQAFGVGLVKTSEDFGSQGEAPSHPELLDWLAVEFRTSGWDIKHMMRLIVTSATYRQSSQVSAELWASDPENRWLARGPRFRLDAEALRDQALAVSGLLVPTVGGPSVKPPQPGRLWEAVAYPTSDTARFVADVGHERVHRRGLYTFWKRTAVAPQMLTLDAPPRESCIMRRERTNTPVQALLLLNDPQYIEAARHLAAAALGAASATDQRIGYLFERALSRPPTDRETAALERLIATSLDHYQAHPDEAERLVTIGVAPPDAALARPELAAWTIAANVVLNMDEFLTKN